MCLVTLAIKYFFVISNHSVTTPNDKLFQSNFIIIIIIVIIIICKWIPESKQYVHMLSLHLDQKIILSLQYVKFLSIVSLSHVFT